MPGFTFKYKRKIDKAFVTPSMFDAKGDVRTATDASITSGSNQLVSAGLALTSADAGKLCIIPNAGAAGAGFQTTIASVAGGVATLAANASTTCPAARSVADAVTTAGGVSVSGDVITSATAAFTVADQGRVVTLSKTGSGIGGTGIDSITARIKVVTNSTTAVLYPDVLPQASLTGATAAIAGATVYIGTDDTTALNNWAAASATEYRGEPGTYLVSSHVLFTSRKGFAVNGNGMTLLAAANWTYDNTDSEGAVVFVNPTNLKVRNLNINGNQISQGVNAPDGLAFRGGYYVKVSGCKFTGVAGNNITARDLPFLTIKDNQADDWWGHGIWLLRCNHARLRENWIQGVGYRGAVGSGTNTQVVGRADGGIGILCTSHAVGGAVGIGNVDAQLIGNYIADTPDTGTKTEGYDGTVYRSNTVVNPHKDGIKIQAYPGDDTSPYVTNGIIDSNTVKYLQVGRVDGGSLIQGLLVKNLRVIANYLIGGQKGSAENGIVCQFTTGNKGCINVLISQNHVEATSSHVSVLAGWVQDLSILNNPLLTDTVSATSLLNQTEIAGNYIHVVTANTFGVVATGQYMDVHHNTVDGTVASCIILEPANNSHIARVNDNKLTGAAAAQGGIRVKNFGTSGWGYETIELKRNRFYNCTSQEILFDVGAANYQNVWIEDNVGFIPGAASPTGHIVFTGTPTTPIANLYLRHNTNNTPAVPTYTAPDSVATAIHGDMGSGRRVSYGTAAPSSGTYATGDIQWNTAPTASAPVAWVCTAGGTPGTWAARGSGLIVASSATAVTSSSTAETTLASVSIPANSVPNGGCLRVTTLFSYPNNANTKTLKVKLGAATAMQLSETTSVTQKTVTEIWNRNGTAVFFTPSNTIGYGTSTSPVSTAAIDFTQPQTLNLNVTSVSGTDAINLEAYDVRIDAPDV